MTCSACGSPVPAGSRFCGHCGAAVARACAECGAQLAEGVRFCGQCGAAVAPSAESEPVGVATPTTERRVTTVLFGDLVGFTTLSESRDPEDVRALLSQYFDTARAIVARYGGTIEKFIGDAVMAVWGVPTGHEDDAERGVRAGLDLTEAVSTFGASVGAPGLAMRVGVVTGEVAVTIGATNQGMVAGDAVNTAARVQSKAAPGAVWVDRQTRELAAGPIEFHEVGAHELKGKAEPQVLFAATAVTGAVGGEGRRDRVQASLVGRRRELASVRELFHAVAEDAAPRLLIVPGDPGVGKTRLGQELGNYLDGLTATVWWHWGRCLSYGEGVAFSALTAAVRGRIGAREDDDHDTVRTRLAASLDEFVLDASERTWLEPRLMSLLGVQDGTADHPRADLFAAWLTWFERLSGPHGDPVVWVIDDAHYADDGLLDFVEHVTTAARTPVLVVVLTRPELLTRRPALAVQRRASVIRLERLSDTDTAALVDALVDGLPDQVRTELVHRAEGNPLFAIETVRAMHDQGLAVAGSSAASGSLQLADGVDSTRLRELAAPTSLHVLVASRLDLLGPPERSVVATGAVLGHSFTPAGVAALTKLPQAQLDVVLRELVSRDLLTRIEDRLSAEHGQYAFSQAIVRTVAYQTQSRHDRLDRHLAAAAYLQTLQESDGELATVIAQHLRDARELAGERDPRFESITTELMAWAQRSGDRALTVGAGSDAVRNYEDALTLAPEPAAAIRLHLLAGRAALRAAQYQIAVQHTRPIALEPDRADRTDAFDAAGIAARALRMLGHLDECAALVTAYVEQWPWEGVDDEVAARLAIEIGSVSEEQNRPEHAMLWRDRAVRLAERSGVPQAIAAATVYLGQSAMLRGLRRIGMATIELATAHAREHHLIQELGICLHAMTAFAITSDLDATLAAGDEAIALALSSGDRNRIVQIVPTQMIALRMSGRWDDLDAVREHIFNDDSVRMYEVMAATQFALAHEARGLGADTVAWPDVDPDDRSYDAVWTMLAGAFAARAAGDLRRAAAIARNALELAYDFGRFDDDYWHHLVLAVEWQLDAGDIEAARDVLAPVTGAGAHELTPLLAAELLRLRGTVGAASGAEPRPVEADLEAGAAALDAFGAAPDAARTRATLGSWLVRQGRAGDAAPHLAAARETFAALGAVRWLHALEDELGRYRTPA